MFQDGYANATLGEHLSASLFRMSVAAGIALVLAIPIGLTIGLNRWAKGIFDPPIEFYWPLPPLAYRPLMIIWLGIGETSKIGLLALAVFAPICFAAAIPARGYGQAIVVPADSPIRTLADLQGRMTGVAKGSSAHNLLVAALKAKTSVGTKLARSILRRPTPQRRSNASSV